MGHKERFPELDERTRKQLIFKSRSLIGNYGFMKDDIEDIQQELYVHLYQQLPKYDPKRSSKATFIDRVLMNAIRDLIRRQTAQMRNYTKIKASLDQPISCGNDDGDEGNITLGETISDVRHASDASQRTKNNMEKIDLRIDVQRILDSFDVDSKTLCLGLSEQKTATDISEALGICRQTFYDRKFRIQKAFEDAGMRAYAGV